MRSVVRGFCAGGLLLASSLLAVAAAAADGPPKAKQVGEGLYDPPNLVAWCIVPFDAKKRGPEERAAMLERLGLHRYAYDWRAEHLPQFEQELDAIKRHGIELTAVWFPTTLDKDARFFLDTLARHHIQTQLWVTGGGAATKTPEEQSARVKAEAARVRPIAEAAAKAGCTVALYNHGGWFGEPENQVAVIKELNLSNVGIVYNLHHGHEHLDRFPELLRLMKPYLLALNLNGMVRDGDKAGKKILVLGQGDEDLKLLKIIRDSGWHGPVGVLNHTDEDAETRLSANLKGLEALRAKLSPKP
ncbi:MAG: TIM barrel protein [Isosphaeraceae bacterium]